MAEPTLPAQIQDERQHAQYQIPLTSLAGYAAGSGIGLLGVAPYDEWKTRRMEAAANQQREHFMRSQQVWRVLHDLHSGKLSFEDLPAEERQTWRGLYEQRKHILSSPTEMFRILNQRPPAEVVRPQAMQQSLFRRLLPQGDTLKRPFQTAVRHPVPLAVGGLGALLGQMYAQNKHDERMVDLMTKAKGDTV